MAGALDRGPRTALVVVALVALVVVGLWLRVRHLGDLGLVVDEGNQALAVRGILATGVPRVGSGMIYLRGVLFLYAQAGVAALLGLDEVSLRLGSAVFGTGVVLATYALGRTIFDRSVGLLAAAVMTFSVWEIELSRYGRFYTLFQLLYVIALLCFYRAFALGERRYRIWFLLASVATFVTHELGVMLATCFVALLPVGAWSWRRAARYAGWAAGMGVLWIGYNRMLTTIDTMTTLRHDVFPSQATPAPSFITKLVILPLQLAGAIGIAPAAQGVEPDFGLIGRLARGGSPALVGLAVIVAAATVYLVIRVFRSGDGAQVALGILIVWAAFLHQFMLVLLLLVVHVACFARDRRSLREPPLAVALLVSGLSLVIWVALLRWAAGIAAKDTALALFSYPRFYFYFLKWFVQSCPLLTLVVAVGSAQLLGQFIRDRSRPAPVFVLGAVFVPAVLASLPPSIYPDSRYVFHLYPLLVLIFAVTAVAAGRRLLAAWPALRGRRALAVAGALLALVVSQDANPVAAWSVGSRTSRTPKDPVKGPIAWALYGSFHQDHKSPSLYVRARLRPGDRVVVSGLSHVITIYAYYIGQVDGAVERPEDAVNRIPTGDGRLEDYITGIPVVEALPDVKAMIERDSGGAVWLLGDRVSLAPENSSYAQPVKDYLNQLARHPDFVGEDGQTFAVRVR
jgi:Dolichyl-phosphate-mannose-protein mannosyltransferase